MIISSRKQRSEVLKWSKTYSPILFLVLSMDGKWCSSGENAENVSSHFKKLWPASRSFITMQARMNAKGLIRLSQLTIPFPSREVHRRYGRQILDDFITLLFGINKYFDGAEDFESMEAFSRDMLDLFLWDERENRDIWTGSILYAMDKQGLCDEAFRMYRDLSEKGERMASVYAMSLLQRCDTEKASAVLEPFRGTETDETLREKLDLLDRLKSLGAGRSDSEEA